MGAQVSWTVDLTTVYASLLLTVLADAGKSVRYLAGRQCGKPRGPTAAGKPRPTPKTPE